MVNKESLPLILGLLLPIFLVSIIVLFYYGIDIFSAIRKIPIRDLALYIIIFIPILLGLAVGIIKYLRPD